MKNLKWTMGILFIGTITIIGCSKNQKVVKSLEGEWRATSFKEDGFEWIVDDSLVITYTWNSCKVENEDCSGSYSLSHPDIGTGTSAFTYSISSDGTIISVDFASPDLVDMDKMTIDEQTETKFSFSGFDVDGYYMEIEMEKQ